MKKHCTKKRNSLAICWITNHFSEHLRIASKEGSQEVINKHYKAFNVCNSGALIISLTVFFAFSASLNAARRRRSPLKFLCIFVFSFVCEAPKKCFGFWICLTWLRGDQHICSENSWGAFKSLFAEREKAFENVKWVFCAWKCQARFRNLKLCIFCVSQAIISGMICSFLLRRAPASIDANDSRELYRSEIVIGMIGAALSRRCVATHWASNSGIDWNRREVINQKPLALRTIAATNKSALSAPYTFM